MKISEIKDMEVLQQMFQNASDMHERTELRAAIRALREQEMNKLSPRMNLSRRRSLHRSRRVRNNETTGISSAAAHDSTASQVQKLAISGKLTESVQRNTPANPAVSKCAEKVAFDNEPDTPRTFVRNSSIRRNRRSQKSTSSRLSDLEPSAFKTSLPEMPDPADDTTAMKLSEHTTAGGAVQREIASAKAPASPASYSLGYIRNPPSLNSSNWNSKAPSRNIGSEGRKLSKENESPVISPYRSPSLYQNQTTEPPRKTSISISQGATCQYKTITTSFRGPTWKPVSSSSTTTPLRRHQSNNSNNKPQSLSEWPQPDRGPSNWTGSDKRRSSLTESSDFSGSSAHPKTPTRVFKAIGKKLFSTKAKTPSASGRQISPSGQPVGGSNQDASRPPLDRRETPSYRQFRTPARESTRLSPFQQRKNIFENGAVTAKTQSKVSFSWNRPRSSHQGMADVAPLSQSSREAGNFSPAITESSSIRPEVETDNDDTVGELEGLLKQYTDPEKRVKIRETIRHLKQSLQEGDPSSSVVNATNKSVLFINAETSPRRHEEDHGAVEVTVALQKTPSSSLSRFSGRSTSLRTPKPSYQPSPQAVNRASSFKLSRPKDFIVQKVGSSSHLTKVPETPPEDFKEYADSLNNNLPDYKPIESTSQRTGFTHNKTASPFAVSSQGSYKKYAWTPPGTLSGQNKSAFSGTPVSATVRSSAAPTGVRRSESTKETRSADFQPIGLVPGNLRRSKSILERILGQKLDAEKSPSTPIQSEDNRPGRIIPKTDPTDKKLEHKPPIHTSPKRESPTPIPKAAPRSKTPTKVTRPHNTVSPPKPPSPLARLSQESPHKERKAESSSRVISRSSSTTSYTSGSSSNSSGDHVYEIAGSDSELSSCELSDRPDSPTLSEIILESRQQDDNETNTEEHTSSVVLSTDRDKDLEGDLVFEEVKQVSSEGQKSEESKGRLVQGVENKQFTKAAKHRVVVQPLTSHKVCEPETARVFNVQVVRPVNLRNKTSAESNQVISLPPTPAKSEPQSNKEAKKSSSSISSTTSSDSEEDAWSDDEKSSEDERDMDRYSSRALQSRVSVKSQISAKEDDVNSNTKTSDNPTSRRLRDRHNKPLNTGDDLKTRMQKFKNQSNGDAVKASASKRNGSVKITGSAGKKVDLSKFENKDDETASSAGKTTVTVKTSAVRTTRRSTSREETQDSIIDTESSKENTGGSARKVSSSSSADDTGGRIRRVRRGKTGSEAVNGLDKLEKASSIATDELKHLGKSSDNSNEIVISTKKSRDRTAKVTEDLNNNTKSNAGDVAPSNENVEVALEDSLSNWSARRRKRREQRLDVSSATTSSTENDKSSEELKTPDKEEEKEIIQRTKAKLHVTHSSPSLSELGSLGDYKLKLHLNGDKSGPTHAKEVIVENEEKEDEENKEAEIRASRVKSPRSRSSRTGSSSASSANGDAEITSSPNTGKLPSLSADDVNVEVVMEFMSESGDVSEELKQETQSDPCETVVTKNDRSAEETREVAEERESNDEEDEESVNIDAVDGNESDRVAYVDDAHDLADDDKEILENEPQAEEEAQSLINDDTAETTIYKDEPVEPQPLPESTEEQKDGEPDKVNEAEPHKPAEEPPQQRNREEGKESSTDELETTKPGRRTRRKILEKEPVEEKPKRRNRNRKTEEETPKQEEKESTDKAEQQQQKQPEEPTETESSPTSKEESRVKPESTEEEPPKAMQPTIENVEEITDIKVLEKMLEVAKEYEDRRRIRGVIRALKRGEKPKVAKDSKYDSKSNGALNALNLLASRRNEPATGDLAKNGALPRERGKESGFVSSRTTVTQIGKTDRGTRLSSITTEKTTRMTSGQKKIGSIFDRGDDEDEKPKSRGSSRLADLERRQAERKRELQRNRSMPASSSSKDARKAFVAKLEAGAPKAPAGKKVGRSPTFVVPNANNVKQLLLKWCQSKTRGYEHVDIMNFSSSWASGMAFCALVHNFFPDAFDYSKLDPKNKAENLELAFTKAEELADIAPLLEVEDMLIMGNRPDSKCIFTYVQFMYNHLKKFDQPLLPTKEGGQGKVELKVKCESEDL